MSHPTVSQVQKKRRRQPKSDWGFSFRRSAPSRYIWYEVKLILAQPKLRKFISPVQTELHYQRHQDVLVHRIRIYDSRPWSIPGARDLCWTHWSTAEAPVGSRRDRRRGGQGLIVTVEFLQLHGGYEVLAGLQTEGLGLGEAWGGTVEIGRGVLRACFARVCVVQEGQRVTVLHAWAGEQQ